jgi:predicted DNA binding CopG/RHH family protein
MKKFKLSPEEREIEDALVRGEYRPAGEAEFRRIANALARRKKDAVLNIRVNSQDLDGLKKKAKRLGVPYQSLISELLHQFAV